MMMGCFLLDGGGGTFDKSGNFSVGGGGGVRFSLCALHACADL